MEIILILFIVSAVVNCVLLYYTISAARRMIIASSNMEALQDIFSSFEGHLNAIHESEMFYGDSTLQALIEHSGLVLDEIKKYKELDTFVFYEEEEDLEDEEKTTEN